MPVLPRAEQIPSELKEQRQWVAWRYEQREGKRTKVPISGLSGELARSNDPQTWCDFEEARSGAARYACDGIGFVVAETDPYCGIDLDHCIDEAGAIAPFALQVIADLHSYTERTPSGNGLRVWVKAALPHGGRKKGHVEMYDSLRFFTFTGAHLETTPATIENRQAQVEALHAKVFTRPAPRQPPAPSQPSNLDDAELLRKAQQARNGDAFMDLWQGSVNRHAGDASAADLALCNYLAFWTGNDAGRIDSLFRQSGLYREKWDRVHYSTGATYGQHTIALAISGTANVYAPPGGRRHQPPPEPPEPQAILPETIMPDPQRRPEVDLSGYPLTDLGNAERLLARHGDDLRYVPPWRSWLAWDGRTWRRDCEKPARGRDFGSAYRLMWDTVRQMSAQFEAAPDAADGVRTAWRAHVKSSEGHRRILSCMESAARCQPLTISDLDQHPHLLPVRNGTVDLRTGKLLPHSRAHLITHYIDLPYHPEARCPAWDDFMSQVFSGDAELIQWIWKVLGYTLTGEVYERVMFILYGVGRNGKGTLTESVRAYMGDYAATVDPKVLLQGRFDDGAPNEIAQLPGKRFVYTSETDSDRRLSEARVKSLADCGTIQTMAKYEAPFEFVPQFKLYLATNHLPTIRGTDKAIWDRIRTIPFARRFYLPGEDHEADDLPADPAIRPRLRAEVTGALARAVAGAMEFYQEGLLTHPKVVQATREYKSASDLIGMFIEECCTTQDVCGEVMSGQLWLSYQRWCDRNQAPRGSRTAFGISLRERGFISFERGRKQRDWWRGITLLTPDCTDEEEAFT